MYEIGDLFDKRSVVGARIEEILSERGYSKSKFCKMCGISRPTIDKILSGNLTSKANFERHLNKILDTLSLTPDMLLGNAKNVYTKAREIRTILHVKEEDITGATHITLERLRKIEAGDSATKAELRDIAACLGTSTRCIDGTYFFHPQVSRPEIILDVYSGDRDRNVMSGFWGHLGIQPVHSENFLWFPITDHTYDLICERMEKPRLIVPCMNNKLLYINPQNINNIVLLEDACDAPGFANWDPAVGEGEVPLVVYETLEDFLFYSDNNQTPPADVISPDFFSFLKDLVSEKNWTETDISSFTQEIVIRYCDGNSLTNIIDFYNDNRIVDEIDLVYEFGEPMGREKYAYFRDHDEVITFINTENISVIELPLVQTEAAIYRGQMEALGEYEDSHFVREDD